MSSGINDLGTVNWKILLCVLGGWILIGLCIIKGVKSVGKVYTHWCIFMTVISNTIIHIWEKKGEINVTIMFPGLLRNRPFQYSISKYTGVLCGRILSALAL